LTPDLRLDLHYQHTEARLDSLSAARIHTGRNDRNEEIASARLDYTGGDTLQFFLKGYFHDWKTAYVQILNPVPAGPPVTVYPAGTFWGYRDYGGSAVLKLHPHRGLEYLFGYDFQSFSGRDDVLLIGDTSEQVHAGVFQLRTTDEISRRARLAAGLRYNVTGGAKKTIWNVSGRYELGEHLYLEGVGGTSFLLPDAGSLYGIDPCCEIGNPNLRPEQSTNLNLTAGGRLVPGSGALQWKASYFHRDVTDLIDTTYDDPAFPNGVYVNVDDKVRVRGVELGLDASFGQAWNLAASYTWSRVRNEGATAQRDRSPSRFAKASLAYAPQHGPFGANVALQWVGDVYSSPSGFPRQNYGNYALIDFGAHLWIDGDARRNRFGVNIENLTGRDYATRGFSSAAADAGGRFLYFTRGVPRTLRVSYGLGF
ncbi:MAG TPA: TonB-dependent receptor, partial [Sphingomonas sp.]|nr:TonB-dependent receptor [Sphingomonas sp.]